MALAKEHAGGAAPVEDEERRTWDELSEGDGEPVVTPRAAILATLLRVGEEREALELLARIRTGFPKGIVADLDAMITADPDLALLRHRG